MLLQLHYICIYMYVTLNVSCIELAVFKLVMTLLGPPSAPTLSCVDLSEGVSGTMNVTVSWTLSGGDSADFYLINITTNAPQTPYGGLLNITTGSVTQCELTGFMAGYEYNITVCGVNCGSQEGRESEPLTFPSQCKYMYTTAHYMFSVGWKPIILKREGLPYCSCGVLHL